MQTMDAKKKQQSGEEKNKKYKHTNLKKNNK